MKPRVAGVVAVLLCVVSFATPRREAWAADAHVATASHAMVVSVSPVASEAGLEVLRSGGNAVDAAIAVAFALAVTFPEAGNIGGGGFMMVLPKSDGTPVCVEYRETAPAAAGPDTFADDARMTGRKVVGVPGTVRGLALAHEKFGSKPWGDLVAPAMKIARDGFPIPAVLAKDLNDLLADTKFQEFKRVYGKPGGAAWQEGDLLKLPDLAQTLELIGREGPDAFYTGAIAGQLVAEMERGDGLITLADLAAYRANVREAVHGTYRGFDIYGPPPPSSGGTAVVEMLNILENFDVKQHDRYSAETLALMIEAMKRAYCDRARYLGDSAFTKIPDHLTTKEYAQQLAATIDVKHPTPSAQLAPELKLTDEGPNTTHFSVVDANGMAVANTYTLQNSYGSRVVVRGAGFLLNNEMTDFNRRPGVTDRAGGIGTPANTIAPGKRMLSSQSPTIVLRDGKLVLVTGSPGGRTIPNTVFNIVLSVLEYDMDIGPAVSGPRLHHQWLPDVARFEGQRDSQYREAVEKLAAWSYPLADRPGRQGDGHSILARDGKLIGAADNRRNLARAVGY